MLPRTHRFSAQEEIGFEKVKMVMEAYLVLNFAGEFEFLQSRVLLLLLQVVNKAHRACAFIGEGRREREHAKRGRENPNLHKFEERSFF